MSAAAPIQKPDFEELLPLPLAIADAVSGLLTAPHWMGLALHLPLRFEDKASITAMDSLQVGQKVNLLATVVGTEVQYHPRKQLRVWVEDGDTSLLLRWLHFYPGLQQKLSEGTRIQISGQIRQGYGTFEMVHPTVKIAPAGAIADSPHADTKQNPAANSVLEPFYPSTGQHKQSDHQSCTDQ